MEGYFLYINLDGFARYYYDGMPDRERTLPNLERWIGSGCLFDDARTAIPAITFPMQAAIVSGCPSAGTRNCWHYLDRGTGKMVKQGRFNAAQTIGEALRDAGIDTISVQQFALEGRGCDRDDPRHLYVQPGGDFRGRFRILRDLARGRAFDLDGRRYAYDALPRAFFLYCDDLDAIGHNGGPGAASTEEGRVERVRARLAEIDGALGELEAAFREAGIWEETTVLLTADHGMVGFAGPSMADDLARRLANWGYGKVSIGEAEPDWAVLLAANAISCQVYFRDERIDLEAARDLVSALPYVDRVLTRGELAARGCDERYADLLVSPVEGFWFGCGPERTAAGACASHDSLHDKSARVFALMLGPKVAQGRILGAPANVYDFVPTCCALAGLPACAGATGRALAAGRSGGPL